jgi:hypothetical protein
VHRFGTSKAKALPLIPLMTLIENLVIASSGELEESVYLEESGYLDMGTSVYRKANS